MLHRFANPKRFLRIAAAVFPWTVAASVALIGLGLYYGLFASPGDYQQGETVRIMYIHVPAAWMALFVYSVMAAASAVGLIWKHPLAHVVAIAAAPIGAGFTLISLASGSLWGRPMWGTWWVWDARLTSVLVLFFLYLGFMALANAFDSTARGEKSAAILALVGAVNVPIIKFSVDWWNTLHQPASVIRMDGPSIDPAMLLPLLLMAAGFMFLFAVLLIIRVRSALLAKRLMAMRIAQLHAGTLPVGEPAAG
jgi:heme exporter protein C